MPGDKDRTKVAHKGNSIRLKKRRAEYRSSRAKVGSNRKLPTKPKLVVDVFSGCGGLSLGFDLCGEHYKTVMALDVEAAPIAALNANMSLVRGEAVTIGQQVDVTDFLSVSEFLTFYVEHVAIQEGDHRTISRLNAVAKGAYPAFRKKISEIDRQFLEKIRDLRRSLEWKRALEVLPAGVLSQTSVIGFHQTLRLPRAGLGAPQLPIILWAASTFSGQIDLAPTPRKFIAKAKQEWESELKTLTRKGNSSANGQLKGSASRVKAFAEWLAAKSNEGLARAWTEWRARRLYARAEIFESKSFGRAIRKLYKETYPVSVLVGGPPCQGFSRIGRGKLRSLRDANVHVHESEEAGDRRNLLLQQYVLILSALRPETFLFENVQHFQSTVRIGDRKFQAAEVLEEAITSVSENGVNYAVASTVVNAARHGVPQTRHRYFMCGIKADSRDVEGARRRAAECLVLDNLSEVPLSAALSGLPPPHIAGEQSGSRVDLSALTSTNVPRGEHPDAYAYWIRQPAPGHAVSPQAVDAHVSRAARVDDAKFFELMGPGTRWMDYRADHAATVTLLKECVSALAGMRTRDYADLRRSNDQSKLPTHDELRSLLAKLDGSLPIRLLLEQISYRQNEDHHLLRDTYLAKRDGGHGDWLARLDWHKPAKTMVSHMSKDTYAFVHPVAPRTLSVREAARIQSFPDWYGFGTASLTEAFKMIGNAVPPRLSFSIARNLYSVVFSECAAASALPAKRVAKLGLSSD